MNHQDWSPVVLKKKSPVVHKPISNPKKEEKEEGFQEPPRFFSKQFGQNLSQLRQKQNLTRVMLAQKLNVKESVISSLENGTEVYNGQLLSKLKRVLGNFEFKA